MPFDFKAFDSRCMDMSVDELQLEWEHYTRLISGSATSTAISGAAIPFTFGVSAIGVGLAAPAIHNARKKREIIERHLNRLGTTHYTRKRDVLTPMAISGTIGIATLGLGSAGAEAITTAAAEHGFASIAASELTVKATTHLAIDGIAVMGEEHHAKLKKTAEAHDVFVRKQALPQQAPVGLAIMVPLSGPYNPSTFAAQSEVVMNELAKPKLDIKTWSSSLSDSRPPAKNEGLLSPTGPYTPLPLYSPISSIDTTPYSSASQEAVHPGKPTFYDAPTFSQYPLQPHWPGSSPEKISTSIPSKRTGLQTRPQQHMLNPSQPTITEATAMSPVSLRLQECSWTSADPTHISQAFSPYQAHSPLSVHDPSPYLSQSSSQANQWSPSVDNAVNPSESGVGEVYHHRPQNTPPQPIILPAIRPMYPSYPGTVIPNSFQQQPRHHHNLDQTMNHLSISSTQTSLLTPVDNPGPAERTYDKDHRIPDGDRYEAIICPVSPAMPDSVSRLLSSAHSSHPQQLDQCSNYASPLPASPMMSVWSSPISPMSPVNTGSHVPVSPTVFTQPDTRSQINRTVFNPYPTPMQSPDTISPSTISPTSTYFDRSHGQSSNPYFPPPPTVSGPPMKSANHETYGYVTPAATPGSQTTSEVYFPPPPNEVRKAVEAVPKLRWSK